MLAFDVRSGSASGNHEATDGHGNYTQRASFEPNMARMSRTNLQEAGMMQGLAIFSLPSIRL